MTKSQSLPLEPSSAGDAHAPLDFALFKSELRKILPVLEADLLARVEESPSLRRGLEARHALEVSEGRTGEAFPQWLDLFIAQIAAAWVLSLVFIRILEDRKLLPHARIAGPGAADSEQLFFRLAPSLGERHYLELVLAETARFPVLEQLFDVRHNPARLLSPSAEGARRLLALFREPTAEAPSLRFGASDTRFLGDLYQDLNESVRDRYALLQTPDFVESYILDHTLEPALERFGLDETHLIDPTCGSGHFLLGAFERLYDRFRAANPGESETFAVTAALERVAGIDINPYAVAIARFRLLLAALEKLGIQRIGAAPKLPLRVATADSLLLRVSAEESRGQRSFFDLGHVAVSDFERRGFSLEDEQEAKAILGARYAAVVGNPPYITVKDKALRDRYCALYKTCSGQYALTIPFFERFFELARPGGFVGKITSNSFMKREFGKALIEKFFPTVNLTGVVNTSGAYIPGHGTPTVIIFGTHEAPQSDEVWTVLSKRGEPSTPADPREGRVWSAIERHGERIGHEDEFISVAWTKRDKLAAHPWSLAGGGADSVKTHIEESAETTLTTLATEIGRTTHTGEDTFFFMPAAAAFRHGVPSNRMVSLVTGEQVRDWAVVNGDVSLFPYSTITATPEPPSGREHRLYWTYRTILRNRQDYGQKIEVRGLQWFEHSMFFPRRFLKPLGIAFAFVATHNHFVLDRGGKVFNRSAPIIKLREDATEDDHLALLAYLNSSTACFWMKQVAYPKGAKTAWEDRYEFAGTALQRHPLPACESFLPLGKALDRLAGERATISPQRIIASNPPSLTAALAEAAERDRDLALQMVALQEKLDWEVYRLFGLVDRVPEIPDRLAPGSRLFERRAVEQGLHQGPDGAWWTRSGYELPTQPLTDEERAFFDSPFIDLLERFEHKRRWQWPRWEDRVREAAHAALLDALEDELETRSVPESGPRLAERLARTPRIAELMTLAGLGDDASALAKLFAGEAVPYLAAHRYKDSGLQKFRQWEETWALQRREDAGEKVEVPVPPKYASGDFRDARYWRLRGKLDVPKERFIGYPGLERDEDGEPFYGWAGWDHAQRARALITLYQERRDADAWEPERLVPILAGVLELLPWLKQWHDEPDEDGLRFGHDVEAWLEGECQALRVTHDDLMNWRPSPKKGRGRKKN